MFPSHILEAHVGQCCSFCFVSQFRNLKKTKSLALSHIFALSVDFPFSDILEFLISAPFKQFCSDSLGVGVLKISSLSFPLSEEVSVSPPFLKANFTSVITAPLHFYFLCFQVDVLWTAWFENIKCKFPEISSLDVLLRIVHEISQPILSEM